MKLVEPTIDALWRQATVPVCCITRSGSQAVPAAAVDVTPANPTISVGQTQQFTANGAVAPTGVSAGGEYTCVRLPDGTAQCTGRNQFGQLGNGTLDQLVRSRTR